MEKKYWLQRISHYRNICEYLLKKHHIVLTGWSWFACQEMLDRNHGKTVIDAIKVDDKNGNYNEFNKLMKLGECTEYRSRWNMWYMAQMKKGDTVLIPSFYGDFYLADVAEEINIVSNLPNIKDLFKGFKDDGKHIGLCEEDKLLHYFDEDGNKLDEIIDLGFFIKVDNLVNKKRAFAEALLRTRMKMRQTSGEITDLKNEVEKAKQTDSPIDYIESLYNSELKNSLLQWIQEKITPDGQYSLEDLVQWYLEQCGAEYVNKGHNQRRENRLAGYDEADCDRIAEFPNLGVNIYVQIKKHNDKTDVHAVEQITQYLNAYNSTDDRTSEELPAAVGWVVTTADKFTDDAIKLAEKFRSQGGTLKLITGSDFAWMLLNKGFERFSSFGKK